MIGMLAGNDCYCDHIQLVNQLGEAVEVHHVVPDDGVPHDFDLQCPCGPVVERLDRDLVLVEHRDQDLCDVSDT